MQHQDTHERIQTNYAEPRLTENKLMYPQLSKNFQPERVGVKMLSRASKNAQ